MNLIKLSFLLVLALGSGACLRAAEKGKSTPAAVPAVISKPQLTNAIPESVFNIPTNPSEGKNPFFPNSSELMPKIDLKTNVVIPETMFVLNGITSPPRRSAMINGRTFEVGEEGEVRLSSGARVLIKCVEIGDDKAVIVTAGQRRELRLRKGL